MREFFTSHDIAQAIRLCSIIDDNERESEVYRHIAQLYFCKQISRLPTREISFAGRVSLQDGHSAWSEIKVSPCELEENESGISIPALRSRSLSSLCCTQAKAEEVEAAIKKFHQVHISHRFCCPVIRVESDGYTVSPSARSCEDATAAREAQYRASEEPLGHQEYGTRVLCHRKRKKRKVGCTERPVPSLEERAATAANAVVARVFGNGAFGGNETSIYKKISLGNLVLQPIKIYETVSASDYDELQQNALSGFIKLTQDAEVHKRLANYDKFATTYTDMLCMKCESKKNCPIQSKP